MTVQPEDVYVETSGRDVWIEVAPDTGEAGGDSQSHSLWLSPAEARDLAARILAVADAVEAAE